MRVGQNASRLALAFLLLHLAVFFYLFFFSLVLKANMEFVRVYKSLGARNWAGER